MRRLAPLVVLLALAALAAVGLAQVDHAPSARLTATAVAGSFEVTNSAEGEPIFAASNLGPGGSARGTVTIGNAGSAPAALTLRRGDLADVPGLGGGALSDHLRLTVVDITAPAMPRTVYSGPLATMPDQPAGGLEPGNARTYEFTATLPDGGEPNLENTLQGASTTVAYAWVAEEAPDGGGEEPGDGESLGGGGEAPGGGDAEVPSGGSGGGRQGKADGGGMAGQQAVLELTVPKVRGALHPRRLLAWARCDEPCRLRVGGRLRATAAGHHRGARLRFVQKRVSPGRAQRLRIPIPRSVAAWLRHRPPPWRLTAKLRFSAVGVDGQRDVVRKKVRLAVRPR